jgi:hypothetical protein
VVEERSKAPGKLTLEDMHEIFHFPAFANVALKVDGLKSAERYALQLLYCSYSRFAAVSGEQLTKYMQSQWSSTFIPASNNKLFLKNQQSMRVSCGFQIEKANIEIFEGGCFHVRFAAETTQELCHEDVASSEDLCTEQRSEVEVEEGVQTGTKQRVSQHSEQPTFQ